MTKPSKSSATETIDVIRRNAARCYGCGDTIESRNRHDFQQCMCGNVFVDGGLEYLRRGGHGAWGFEDLSVIKTIPKEEYDMIGAAAAKARRTQVEAAIVAYALMDSFQKPSA